MNLRAALFLLIINVLFIQGLFAQLPVDSSTFTYDSLITRVNADQTAYKTFSGRAKLVWDDGTTEQDFAANIRMLKDSLVWMSLTGMMGVEGARVLITKDSFSIIYKLQNQYSVREFSFLENWLLFPVSFKMLQQMIAGEKIDINEKASTAAYQDSMFILYYETNKMLEKVWVNTGSYTISKILLKDKLLTQQMTLTFDNYNLLQGKPFSYTRSIDIMRDGLKMRLDIDYNKIKLNEGQGYPFEIGEKYKRVEEK